MFIPSQYILEPNVKIELYDGSGNLLRREAKRNAVVKTGRNIITELLLRAVGGTGTGFAPSHIGLGDDNTAVTDNDTALGNEVYRDFVTVRNKTSTATISTATFQLFLDTDAGNGLDFSEAGMFDSPDNGVMFSRVVFTEINKTSSIQVAITWDINVESA